MGPPVRQKEIGMSGKHTPGPWVLKDARRLLRGDKETDYGRAEFFDQELEANARLIAAAPDMLEALRKANYSLAWHVETQGNGAGMDAFYLDVIRAAIAKAEGAA